MDFGRKRVLLAAFLLGASACLLPALSSAAQGDGRLIAKFRGGATRRHQSEDAKVWSLDLVSPRLRGRLLAAGVGGARPLFPSFDPARLQSQNELGEPIRLNDLSGYFELSLPPGIERDKAAAALRSDSDVLTISPDRTVLATTVHPNDPLYANQWWLHNTGANSACYSNILVSDCDINAPEAWSISTGSSVVNVGVIDTGVQWDHPDLYQKVQRNQNWTDDEDANDLENHGTSVAGIIAAKANNNAGVAGVAWNANIYNEKVLSGESLQGTVSDLAQGVNAVAGLPVINMSLVLDVDEPVLREAVENAFLAGSLIVSGSGNDNQGVLGYPAAYDREVLGVGAVFNNIRWEHRDIPISGCATATVGSRWGYWVDLAAPGGTGIASTGINDTYRDCALCQTSSFSGTSAAAPVVSGVAALVKSAHTSLTGEDIAQVLYRTALNLYPGISYPNDSTGYGLVRADAALAYLASPKTVQHPLATAMTQVESVDTSVVFSGIDGLTDGTYNVHRFKLRKAISFSSHFNGTPDYWIRQSGTHGSTAASSHSDVGGESTFGELVAGTLTSSGCTVQTYVYDILDGNGAHLMYWPVSPSSAAVAMTAVGTIDDTAPSTPTISTSAACSQIDVTWVNTGDDGMSGQASVYELRRSTSPITLTNWATADVLSAESPGAPNVSQTVSDYVGGGSPWIYYGIRLRDDADNWSGLATASGKTPMPENCEGGLIANQEGVEPLFFQLARPLPVVTHASVSMTFVAPIHEGHKNLVVDFVDVSGRTVRRFEMGRMGRGGRALTWDLHGSSGERVGAGVYFMRARLGSESVTRRLIVL